MNADRVSRFLIAALLMGGLLAGSATFSHALPIFVPNFASDPTGAQFTIQAVSRTDDNSINLPNPPSGDPDLTYGILSPDGTPNTLLMEWEQSSAGEEAQAGWELVFGVDPDIRNLQIILSINPPGGWTDAAGTQIASPGNPGIGDLFQGIRSLSVIAVDNVNAVAGGWGFNTDQDLLFPLVNDPTAVGASSLESNAMQTVTINVLLGQAAGSATITGGLGGPFTAPNFLIGGNGNFQNIAKLQFFENGILQGGVAVVPGQSLPGLNNYWDHITVTPEPSSVMLLGIGLVGLFGYGRRRRH